MECLKVASDTSFAPILASLPLFEALMVVPFMKIVILRMLGQAGDLT
jgi:hypothetical protein